MVSIIHRIRERRAYPIVTHIFTGETREQAFGYFKAHLGTDAFLRSCETTGRWGKIVCNSDTRVVVHDRPLV